MSRLMPTSARVVVALALIAVLAVAPTEDDRAGAATPVLSVSETDLVDFQPIRVTGSGYSPGALLEIYECRGGATDEFDCDADNAFFADIDGAGNVDLEFYVDARIFLGDGTEVDCRTDPAGCTIGVGFIVEAGAWPQATLDFDPAAPLRPPVTATVTPSTDLADGQTVQIAGQNLSPREGSYAYLCAAGAKDIGYRCDLDGLASGVPDAVGDTTLDLAVRGQFRTPLGVDIDCLDPASECAINVTWGFSPPPDRRAVVPISLRTDAAPSTTTSTAPAPPTGPPAASPARPVSAQPTFTG